MKTAQAMQKRASCSFRLFACSPSRLWLCTSMFCWSPPIPRLPCSSSAPPITTEDGVYNKPCSNLRRGRRRRKARVATGGLAAGWRERVLALRQWPCLSSRHARSTLLPPLG